MEEQFGKYKKVVTNSSLTSVFFTDAQKGYAVGFGSEIFKTVDGGNTWIASYFENVDWFLSVCFADSLIGYATGSSGTILKTTDGGINWITQKSGTSNHLYSVFSTKEHNVYTVGDAGTILKLVNDIINSSIEVSKNTMKIFPNPTNQLLNLIGIEDGCQVIIFDMKGEIVLSQLLISNQINISHLKSGIYIIKVICESGITSQKLVKQ